MAEKIINSSENVNATIKKLNSKIYSVITIFVENNIMTRQKNVIMLFVVVIQSALCTLGGSRSLQAQTDGWELFMKFPVSNMSERSTVHQFGNLMYFSNTFYDRFYVVDFMQNVKTFTPFSINAPAGINISNLGKPIMDFDHRIYYPRIQTIGGGLFRLTNALNDNPNMDVLSFKTIFGIEEPPNSFYDAHPFAVQYVFFPIPSNSQYTTWCYIGERSLKFTDRNKPDSVIANFPFPEYNSADTNNGFEVAGLYTGYGIIPNYSTFELLFQASRPDNAIVKFDLNTHEFTRYKIEDLPLEYDTISGATVEYYVYNSEMITHALASWTVHVIQKTGSELFYSNVLLTYTKDGFKSILLKPANYTKYYVEGKSLVRCAGKLNDTTIWFSYRIPTEMTNYMYNSEIITYNLRTCEYGSICIPPEIVANYPQDNQAFYPFPKSNTYVTSATELKQPNGKKVIGILLNIGHFLFYDPTVSVEEVDNRIFQTVGIRSIYPNPATAPSKITANIMCYLSTVSDVEIGLYDFMGQKVLDLSNHFEYEPATYTIHISFVLPKNLSKGSYFLVVRSGTETRTRGIIVK
ncbi:MAG: T9SS type A sorting domain-containing protein [Firmicutes bacterium]|nr:T9SS type A sorting domain-containing protein [Bacillota bacterium]